MQRYLLFIIINAFISMHTLFSNDNKITQLLHVEANDTHILDTSAPQDLLYYIKNNNIYFTQKDKLTEKQELEIYEESNKDGKFRKVNNRTVLIGQPVKIIKDNNKTKWYMPAVINKDGFFGTMFRPDIYTIVSQDIDTKLITNEPEPIFKKDTSSYSDSMATHYVIHKEYSGHHTQVKKIGIFNDKVNELTIFSGSEWPSTASRVISNSSSVQNKDKNIYLLDVNKLNNISCKTEKPFFKKKWTLIFDKDSSLQLPFLPNVVVNTQKTIAQSVVYNVLKQHKALFKDKRPESLFFYITEDEKNAVLTLIKNENINITDINKNSTANFHSVHIYDKLTITAQAFDFEKNTLFYATYNKKNKESLIVPHSIQEEDIRLRKQQTTYPIPKTENAQQAETKKKTKKNTSNEKKLNKNKSRSQKQKK